MPPEKAEWDSSPQNTAPLVGVEHHPSPVVAVEMTPIVPVRVFNSTGEYFDTETHLFAPMKVLQWAIEDFFKVKPETQQLLYNREPIDPTRSLHDNGCLLLKGEPYVKIVFHIKRGPLLNLVCHWSRTHEEIPIACLETCTIAEVKQILYKELVERYRRRRQEEEKEAARQGVHERPPGEDADGIAVSVPPSPPLPSRMRILWRYMELNDKATLDYYRVPTNAAFFVLLKRRNTSGKIMTGGAIRQGSNSGRSSAEKASSVPLRESPSREEQQIGNSSYVDAQDSRCAGRQTRTPPREREVLGAFYSSSQYPSATSIPVVPSQLITSPSDFYSSSAPSPPTAARAPTVPPQRALRGENPLYSQGSTHPSYRAIPPLANPPPAAIAGSSPSQLLYPSPLATGSLSPTNTGWIGGEDFHCRPDQRIPGGLPSSASSYTTSSGGDGTQQAIINPSQSTMMHPFYPNGSGSHTVSPYDERNSGNRFTTLYPPAVMSPPTTASSVRSSVPTHLFAAPPYSFRGNGSSDPTMPRSDCAAGVQSMRMVQNLQEEIHRLQKELQVLRQQPPPVPPAPPTWHLSALQNGLSCPTSSYHLTEPKANTPGLPLLGTSLVSPLMSQEHAECTLKRIDQLESSVTRLHTLLEKFAALVH